MTARVLVVAALAGCSGLPEQRAAGLEGFEYGWVGLNHRLSGLRVGVSLDHSEVNVIGGTSTTQEIPPAQTCEETCREFPITDEADVAVRWAVVESTKTAFVPGTAALQVGRDGGSAVVTVELPKGAKGEGTALISGFVLSTDHPLSGGDACYDPRYGWHPRQITISVGDVTIDGDTATVPVEGAFSAGKTYDDDRECIDLVNDQAVVELTVTVLVAVGNGAVEIQPLEAEAVYPFSGDAGHPEEQVLPEPTQLSWSIEDPLVGFRSLDFRFDEHVGTRFADRGAYLRTFGFWAEPGGAANAFATNYSPGTQLQDFSYRFEGEVVAIEHLGTVTRGTSTATLPAALDANGAPVVHSLEH